MVCIVVHFHLGMLTDFQLTGVPVVWMVSSNGTEVTIKIFLEFIKGQSPEVTPQITMSDYEQAQMNVIKAMYPETTLLLCWWHVLCTMWIHFHTEEFPDLWECMHKLVKTPDQSKFDSLWEWIQTDPSVSLSFIDYLKTNWMSIVPL